MRGESYNAFLTRLAAASGIETPTRAELAKFDKARTKKTSNNDWTHPHDPDAKVTKMKDGRTHREHAKLWGAQAASGAAGVSTGLNPACQDRKAGSSAPLSTATRTVRNGWTVSRFHRICCFLIIRLAMISFTADSANAVEIGTPALWRVP